MVEGDSSETYVRDKREQMLETVYREKDREYS